MSDRTTSSTTARIIAALIGTPILYVLTCGPMFWVVKYPGLPLEFRAFIGLYFVPLGIAFDNLPEWMMAIPELYLNFWE